MPRKLGIIKGRRGKIKYKGKKSNLTPRKTTRKA